MLVKELVCANIEMFFCMTARNIQGRIHRVGFHEISIDREDQFHVKFVGGRR